MIIPARLKQKPVISKETNTKVKVDKDKVKVETIIIKNFIKMIINNQIYKSKTIELKI